MTATAEEKTKKPADRRTVEIQIRPKLEQGGEGERKSKQSPYGVRKATAVLEYPGSGFYSPLPFPSHTVEPSRPHSSGLGYWLVDFGGATGTIRMLLNPVPLSPGAL